MEEKNKNKKNPPKQEKGEMIFKNYFNYVTG